MPKQNPLKTTCLMTVTKFKFSMTTRYYEIIIYGQKCITKYFLIDGKFLMLGDKMHIFNSYSILQIIFTMN